MEYDYLFKFVVTGNSGVGKSSLITRFADDSYADNYVSTVGVDFRIRTLTIDGKSVKLQIWDTAGQERFRTIICSYYRGAHGIVIVYDITDEKSFRDVRLWLEEVERHANENVCKVIVGNKSDLAACRAVDWLEAHQFVSTFCPDGVNFIEASAKSSRNVQDVFTRLAADLIARRGRIHYSQEAAVYPSTLSLHSYSTCMDESYGKKSSDCCKL